MTCYAIGDIHGGSKTLLASKFFKQEILEDNNFDLLKDNIEESCMEFEKWILPDLDHTKLFNSALVNVLIKRAYKYKGAKS